MSDELRVLVEGEVGRLRLDRPKAIHALTLGMCDAMIEALLAWRDDAAVRVVMIDHAEGRGFCAGGDIRLLAESAVGDGVAARAFYHREYRLNHLLFTYAKPIVAFMDGITLGGGVGISQPARYRVVTERTRYGMPETGIGLFPDVGGGWYLPRMPGRSGTYLALTGGMIGGADCVALGIATHYVESARVEEAKAAIIADPDDLDAVLDAHAGVPPASPLAERLDDIDRLFASDRLETIMAALADDPGAWAAEQLATLRRKSPQTMKVALRQLAEGARMPDFAALMKLEYDIVCRVIERPDFAEGVRAVIVDKDNDPRWDPATPEAVSDALIDGIFAPLPAGEAWTPLPEAVA